MVKDEKTTEKCAESKRNLREFCLDDLLDRKRFEIKRELIDCVVKDKTVLVTGGAGSIGKELCFQVLKFGCKKLIVLDYHENGVFYLRKELEKSFSSKRFETVIATVREKSKINAVFGKYKPAR